MQIVDFLDTAEWIAKIVPSEFVEHVFMGSAENTLEISKSTHAFVRIQDKLIDHPYAPQILEAFGLSALLNREIFGTGSPEDAIKAGQTLAGSWLALCNCRRPIALITVPEAIRKIEPRDEILTIEFRSQDETRSIIDVSLVLVAVNEVYAAINRLRKVDDPEKLSMIFSCMGSGVRFDFTGVGETIKEFKSLIIDIWHTIRHREAEDLQANVKATTESLALIREIRNLQEDGTLDSEEANHLTATISSNTNLLFRQGVSIREIVPSEFVNNEKLLEEYRQKLLPAPAEIEKLVTKSKARKPRAKKKKHTS